MKIFYRGREFEFPEGTTLETMVTKRELNRLLGIWVNGKLIEKDKVRDYILHDGDKVRVQQVYCLG